MKPIRLALTLIVLSISAAAIAQHEHGSQPPAGEASAARQAFDALKTLAGSWEGTLTPEPPVEGFTGAKVKVVIRVTSRGNAIMHEMSIAGLPDNPITMLYLEDERLMLMHYCDMGNRPRMAATTSNDRARVAFEVQDVSGSTGRGHMADTVFTLVDADHHFEEWVSVYPGGRKMKGRFDLKRTKEASGPFGE